MHRGNVQSIINQFTSAASSLLRFVNELSEFWGLRNLVPTICERLTYCSAPELIVLMELPYVRMPRAKAFYNAGFKTLEKIAQCPLQELCTKIEKLSYAHGHEIIQFAKKKFLERADELELEVEHLKTIAQPAGFKIGSDL
jgi:replicative superfamily II helicase